MQLRVDELVRQSEADGFQLSESKKKELNATFLYKMYAPCIRI